MEDVSLLSKVFYRVLFAVIFLAITLNSSASNKKCLIWWDVENIERYINKYESSEMDIEEIREQEAEFKYALREVKNLVLNCGTTFPAAEENLNISRESVKINLIKTPEGNVLNIDLSFDPDAVTTAIPQGDDTEGIWLLCSFIDRGRMDYNGDGTMERVHFYPKAIIGHYKTIDDITTPRMPVMDKPDIALEITPLRASRYIGIIQISHRDYDMKVTYRGEPLANSKINVFTERGWHKVLRTSSDGTFAVNLPETRGVSRNWEKYLYVAEHLDKKSGTLNIATLQMVVDPPWPEWRSYSDALIFWAITGTGIFVLIMGLCFFISARRNNAFMARFENHKVVKG